LPSDSVAAGKDKAGKAEHQRTRSGYVRYVITGCGDAELSSWLRKVAAIVFELPAMNLRESASSSHDVLTQMPRSDRPRSRRSVIGPNRRVSMDTVHTIV
jgi:hypothetical protein